MNRLRKEIPFLGSDGLQNLPAQNQNRKTVEESGINATAVSAESEQTAYSTTFHGNTYSSLSLDDFLTLSYHNVKKNYPECYHSKTADEILPTCFVSR